ncbi:unnamed protein product [Brachionus calyciflorus]|uniref:Uncharacterized protein n=1 Tax=Brachionus calyciflorus TaxID=104777 RepID=A0A814BGE6_9BILA|nr:unnamed protein product [Brachionus calyciflorus]
MNVYTCRNSHSGLRKYPASEYSDRTINLNKLEDRNLENSIKLIEKERNQILQNLNRDIRKLEEDYEEREEEARKVFNLKKKKYLNANLHNNLISNQKNDRGMSSKINSNKLTKYNSNPNLIIDKEMKENRERLVKNLSATPRLSKEFTDPLLLNRENNILIPRSRSSFDINETTIEFKNSFKRKSSKKFDTTFDQRPNSSDLETRKQNPKNSNLGSSMTSLSILPRAPISVSDNSIKKIFAKQKFGKNNSLDDSNSLDDERTRNILPLSVSSKSTSPVLV